MRQFTIKLVTLPDVHDYKHLSPDIIEYGRFGYTTNDSFFVSDIRSSHPYNTKIGGYYAMTKDNKLLLSPRGSFYGFKDFILNIIKNGDINIIMRGWR